MKENVASVSFYSMNGIDDDDYDENSTVELDSSDACEGDVSTANDVANSSSLQQLGAMTEWISAPTVSTQGIA